MSRVKKKFREPATSAGGGAAETSLGGHPVILPTKPVKNGGGKSGFCGLLGSFAAGREETENLYLYHTGDTGRIANRAQDDKWDVW